MKFTINENTWRCGGNRDNKHGEGATYLLNDNGYMCCLGQIACQLGYHKSYLLRVGAPGGLPPNKEDKILRNENGYGTSELAGKAMAINDDINMTLEEMKKTLVKNLLEGGIMGWASGASILSEVWNTVYDYIPASERKSIAKQLIQLFESHDCDTICESWAMECPEFAEAVYELHPNWRSK